MEFAQCKFCHYPQALHKEIERRWETYSKDK